MLDSNRKGFAIMSEDLQGISYEAERLEDCLRWLHKGSVIAERIPYVSGFTIQVHWFRDYYKPIRLRSSLKNIFYLHFQAYKTYSHKTGKVISPQE